MQSAWEYETLKIQPGGFFIGGKIDHEQLGMELNRRGAAGWELVTALEPAGSDAATREIVLIFKRAVAR